MKSRGPEAMNRKKEESVSFVYRVYETRSKGKGQLRGTLCTTAGTGTVHQPADGPCCRRRGPCTWASAPPATGRAGSSTTREAGASAWARPRGGREEGPAAVRGVSARVGAAGTAVAAAGAAGGGAAGAAMRAAFRCAGMAEGAGESMQNGVTQWTSAATSETVACWCRREARGWAWTRRAVCVGSRRCRCCWLSSTKWPIRCWRCWRCSRCSRC